MSKGTRSVRESFKASAPGKLMLLGEHAVLHGRRCIVCAVNQRMNLFVRPRRDLKINIESELGAYQTDVHNPFIDDTFRFVLTVIDRHKELLDGGFDLKIESDFIPALGLGSSAAVTAAMTAAVFHLAGLEAAPIKIFDHSLTTVRSVQGGGSGADLAASVFGGVLMYRFLPNEIVPLDNTHPISVVYSGRKTQTMQVVDLVEKKRAAFPGLFDSIYKAMDDSAALAAKAVNNNDWHTFGELLDINQGLMEAIGVSDKNLSRIVYTLRRDPGILGAKISGSGLGDCVVGLGTATDEISYDVLPVQMSREGVKIE